MRTTRSRRITALLATAGAAFAVSATIGAATALADPDTIACQPGQVVIDGQCSVPDANANNVPAPNDMHGDGTGMSGGDGHR